MKDKKQKKNWGLIFFIVVIMIGTSFSFIFYGFSPSTDKVKYKEFSFVNRNNVWLANVNGRQAAFTFLPTEVEKINLSADIISRLQNKFEIDVTSDFNSTNAGAIALAEHQMGLTLAEYNIYLREGFTSNSSFNFPIIKCENSNKNVPVIYFKSSNTTSVYSEGDCIIAEGHKDADFIGVKDRLLYGILGVIK